MTGVGVIDLDTPAPAPGVAVTGRSLAPFLISLVLLWSLGAAAPPPAPAVTIPATFLDETFVDGNRLFVVDQHGQLRIFRLPDAHPLGQMEIGSLGSISGVRRVGDVLLVTAGGPRVTEAVDAATGRQLWKAAADVVAVTGGTVLLTNDLSIWAADPHTGRIRWQIDQPTVGSRYRVTAGPDSMTSYDGLSGALLATRKIHLSGIIYSYISDDRFVIGDSSGLSAYTLPALTPLWHAPTDPATGRTLWSSPRWAAVAPLGPALVATTSLTSLDTVPLYLLDPATGRPRGDFGGWRAVLGPGGTLRYALHPTSDLFGELDPTDGTVRVIGRAPGVSGHCDVSAGALVYHQIDGSIAVWRFG